jgi:lipopolysaccharide biosynthesis glycosyltransferase
MDIIAAKYFPLLTHLRSAAYGRLFLQDYLKANYSRVLYIDGDTLSGPVDIDFNAHLSGKVLGAVQDIGVVASGGAAQLLHPARPNCCINRPNKTQSILILACC